MTAPARIRLLLLALAAAAVLGLLYWPEAEEPNRGFNPNNVRVVAPAAPGQASPSGSIAEQEAEAEPPRSATLSDSEFVRLTAGYGMLLRHLEYGTGDRAAFYFVDLRDSTRSLPSLGFIQASSLLDSTQVFAALADSTAPGRVGVAAVAPVDSALRVRIDECITELAVPTRRLSSDGAGWSLALMPGAEPALPADRWGSPVSASDRQQALRLAQRLPADSVVTHEGNALDSTMVAGPPVVKSLHRFTVDGTHFLVADVRIVHRKRAGSPSGGDAIHEQRLFVAERSAGDPSGAFQLTWSRVDAGYGDEVATEEPVMMLRLGADRLLTLQTKGDYKDGGGGLFVSRVGEGRWTVVASWYAGC